jgi:hypothetical protein
VLKDCDAGFDCQLRPPIVCAGFVFYSDRILLLGFVKRTEIALAWGGIHGVTGCFDQDQGRNAFAIGLEWTGIGGA